MKKSKFILVWALLAGACLLAPDVTAQEESEVTVAEPDSIVEDIEEEKPWNHFRLNEDVTMSFNGYLSIYHIRNHNSYHLDSNAAFTEISAGLGVDLAFKDEFSGQFRLVGTGLYGRPENYLGVEPEDMETTMDLANVTWHTELMEKPFHITAGIQELIYGDGFLIMDGFSEEQAIWTQPLRSFPAVKGSLDLGDGHFFDAFAAHVRNIATWPSEH